MSFAFFLTFMIVQVNLFDERESLIKQTQIIYPTQLDAFCSEYKFRIFRERNGKKKSKEPILHCNVSYNIYMKFAVGYFLYATLGKRWPNSRRLKLASQGQ